MHFLAGIFLLPSFMVWKQAYCQPTYSTMRHSPTTAIVRPTGVICVKLLTKENAFFDPETELMFKCSTSTCPGVFGCVKCCPKLNRKKAQIAETTRSKALLPPEKDVVFLTLLGVILVLGTFAVFICMSIMYRKLKRKFAPNFNYSLALNDEKKGKGHLLEAPSNWTKLSGRSCKMCPKGTKLNLQQEKKINNETKSCPV